MKKREEKRKREILLRIIELCKSVEERNIDPFEVDVINLLDRLKEILPKIEEREELRLDADAVFHLSKIICKQADWIALRSSFLLDPLLLLLKIESLSKEELAEIFLRSWHPIVELERISEKEALSAVSYWRNLLDLDERRRKEEIQERIAGSVSADELLLAGFSTKEEFFLRLAKLRKEVEELKEPVDYWDFILDDSYEGTLKRAYLLSFLCGYGWAELSLIPLEEKILVWLPHKEGESYSLPVSISYDEWKRRKEEKSEKH
jgi:hypothetical protein